MRFNQSIGRIASLMVEFGHLTWGAPFAGAEMASHDEELGFDIRYFVSGSLRSRTWRAFRAPTSTPSRTGCVR